jgi:hypothetical protein
VVTSKCGTKRLSNIIIEKTCQFVRTIAGFGDWLIQMTMMFRKPCHCQFVRNNVGSED